MNKEQYQDKYQLVSNEEWKVLEEKGLIPDRTSQVARAKFKELMLRRPEKDGTTFNWDEIIFLGGMDLVSFGSKFPIDAGQYMYNF
jgi:hypothetical protein